ncbi:MAG: HAD-IA family hydrolase [Acidimicrobiales bacterium]
MINAVIFDVDGVLTDTARLHFRAWSRLFREILPSDVAPFGRSDYERLVDGRSRRDGLRAVLDSRRIPAASEVVLSGFARRKQDLFLEALATEPVPGFADAGPCVARLKADGILVAAASSSRNARAVLRSCGLIDSFGVIVDGEDMHRLDLRGKPAPDLFVCAADLLAVEHKHCALVEDSLAGLQAGRRGGLGLLIALDRSGAGRQDLQQAADVVALTLDDIDLALLRP